MNHQQEAINTLKQSEELSNIAGERNPPMTTIDYQQAAVEAGAKALADDWNPDRDPVLTAMFSDYSATVLTAATPHLRAGIAEEVRAIDIPEHRLHDQLPSDHWYAGQKAMRDEIAALLEVGAE